MDSSSSTNSKSSRSGQSSSGHGGGGSRIAGLDAVRAGAIALVLIDHLLYTVSGQIPGWSGWGTRALNVTGSFGVDAFFVLSGYLITGLLLTALERDGASLSTVWRGMQRRWARTLPLYLLVVLITLGAQAGAGDIPADRWGAALARIAFCGYLLPGVGGGGGLALHFLPVEWSLAVEEWAYAILPLSVLAGALLLRSVRRGALAALLAICAVETLLRWRLGLGLDWDPAVRTAAWLRLDAIAIGGIAAWVARYHPLPTSGAPVRAALAGAALLGLASLEAALRNGTPGADLWLDVFQWPVIEAAYGVLILAAAGVRTIPHLGGAVTRVALWSYAIYLLHPLVMWSACSAYDMGQSLDLGAGPLVWAALLLAVSVGIGALVYTRFEAPVTASLKRRLEAAEHGRRVRLSAPPAAAAAAATAGPLVAVID